MPKGFALFGMIGIRVRLAFERVSLREVFHGVFDAGDFPVLLQFLHVLGNLHAQLGVHLEDAIAADVEPIAVGRFYYEHIEDVVAAIGTGTARGRRYLTSPDASQDPSALAHFLGLNPDVPEGS